MEKETWIEKQHRLEKRWFWQRWFDYLTCKHHWSQYGWNYIQCQDCHLTRYNPAKNAELMNQFSQAMVDKGMWKAEEVSKLAFKGWLRRN